MSFTFNFRNMLDCLAIFLYASCDVMIWIGRQLDGKKTCLDDHFQKPIILYLEASNKRSTTEVYPGTCPF